MFDIFGIRAKRMAKKKAKEDAMLALAQAKKQEYLKRKGDIESYLDSYVAELKNKQFKEFEERSELVRRINKVCPSCLSNKVVQKIVRTKGEIHGEGSSSITGGVGGGFLGLGGYVYGSGHSKIDGNIDTIPINQCKECGNEWNVTEAHLPYIENVFSPHDSSKPFFLYNDLKEYIEMKYDPNDFKNEFNSLEEMREDLINECSTSCRYEKYRISPRFMIEYALFGELKKHEWRLDGLNKLFNFNKDDDAYSYKMSDELWEITKKLIGWEENYYVRCDCDTTISCANTAN